MFTAGQKLNEITGYSDIEALKKSIEQQGTF
jgi:She9 / Mdm33 family